jgi:hypothetical protein
VLVTRVDGDDVDAGRLGQLTAEGAAAMRQAFPMPISRRSTSARALLERRVVAIPDVLADEDYEVTELALRAAFRSTLAVPLMRDGRPFGPITRRQAGSRRVPGIAGPLLQTFASRPSSRWRTCACSTSSMHAIEISPRRSSSRPRPATSCA